ncbi:MAG TPA: amidohydrolase family protein [Bryobacteraceae bacterium]|jgi:5-methylthioadenosine/S-adenosylhomocysteine deaminase|nr:amidohydrolase family protein [Bryobacteraceae bacterium]
MTPWLRFFIFLLTASCIAQEAADWLITARYVVTMDARRRVITDGAVAVRGDSILAVGPEADLRKSYKPRQTLASGDAILAPGLINTHTHAPMSLFRGIADDLNLQDWLQKYIFPAEAKNVSPEFVRAGTRLACLEMLRGGTTTYADMYYFEEVIADETAKAGMRGVLGQTIIQFPVADAKNAAQGLARAEKYLTQFRNHPLITAAVAPHAVYTNTDETLRATRTLADRFSAPVLIHVSETRKENDDLRAKRNLSPTGLLEQLGVLNGRTLAAHEVWTSDEDIALLAKRGTGVAHCPSSNMKLASGIAPVLKLLAAGVAVGLGTDGVAGSNNDVSMFEEMDLASKLQKVSQMDPRALPAKVAVEMATIGGAKALGMEKQIGSLEPGKRADLIAISLQEPNAVPLYDVYSQMVFALKASDVSDVFINGKQIMKSRQMLTLDSKRILAEAQVWKQRITKSLRAPE